MLRRAGLPQTAFTTNTPQIQALSQISAYNYHLNYFFGICTEAQVQDTAWCRKTRYPVGGVILRPADSCYLKDLIPRFLLTSNIVSHISSL